MSSELKVDTISEKTPAGGVTIDGVLVKDSNVDSSKSGGLRLLKRATLSNVSTSGTDFDNIFTTTYDNYLVQVNNIHYYSNSDFLQFKFRTGGASGSDATLATYSYAWEYQSLNNDANGDRGATSANTADYGWVHWYAQSSNNAIYDGQSELVFKNPNKAVYTVQHQDSIEWYNASSEWRWVDARYLFPEATQFTGLRFQTNGGNNFDANISVYGYVIS